MALAPEGEACLDGDVELGGVGDGGRQEAPDVGLLLLQGVQRAPLEVGDAAHHVAARLHHQLARHRAPQRPPRVHAEVRRAVHLDDHLHPLQPLSDAGPMQPLLGDGDPIQPPRSSL